MSISRKLRPLTHLAVAALILLAGATVASADVAYGVGSWPEKGLGNHRAIVHVSAKADAVWARIEWRRRDREPEKKDIRVYDLATGQRVMNVVPMVVAREIGEVVFQPATAPGDYAVYYLPYNPGVSNFDDPGTYFPPQDTADAAWVAKLDLVTDARRTGYPLPRAELVRIEARGEFHRMDPMEVIATPDETAKLLAANPDRPYLLFPEDRKYPVRMFDDLPQKWIKSGPATNFYGEPQPGEYYVFQIGVYAARKAIPNLAVEFYGLRGERDTIPERGMISSNVLQGGRMTTQRAITCFNLEGTDWLGRPMQKKFEVGRGLVRPLWIGVQIPPKAKGGYAGTVTVKPEGAPETTVHVVLEVKGPEIADGGVNDLWRMARLKWLNSTLGLDDEVIPPYTPLKVYGDSVDCLLRTVRFGKLGLPDNIIAKERDILAAPMTFVVQTARGAEAFSAGKTQLPRIAPGAVERITDSTGQAAGLRVTSKMEADGCVQYLATLKAKQALDLRDVRLEIPLKREVATYSMGLGKRGGYRGPDLKWKWNIDHADNQIWIGDCDGGVQLYLQGPKDVWDVCTLKDSGLPESWANGGKGGCDVVTEGNRVVVRAYSGARKLAAGEELAFRFRLLITPFKPLDPKHWAWRYGDTNADANILHIHHATPENPYINYPFVKTQELTNTIKSVKSVQKRTDFGKLSYPAAGNVNLRQGTLHAWVRVNFDPKAGGPQQPRFNQALFSLAFPNEDELGFYWNIDVRGMRSYVRNGSPTQNVYPAMVDASSPEWQKGERHLLTLSWGENLAIFIDGKLRAQVPYRGLAENRLKDATMRLEGEGFILDGLKITDAPFAEGQTATPTVDDHTLLLDTFGAVQGTQRTTPQKAAAGTVGELVGTIELLPTDSGKGLHLTSRPYQGVPNGVNLYYTVRELSNHAAEIWPLRSLGDEVYQGRSSFVYSVDKTFFGQPGGGYPWLQEHLVSGYVPTWRQPLWDDDHCAAIATQGLSRWHNYYVEGMQWLMRNTGLDGLYLDGIGYDREIMKRIAKVMYRNNPGYRINFHSGNNYDFMDNHTSPANSYMEHFPYISNLWFGEMYDYNRAPDYWLVEISGIPFGLTSEMLNYENGGNPYRGMVYGMTGRQHSSAVYMWRFWDQFGIQNAEMQGYWSPKCPVKTDHPGVVATVYKKPGQALIALAHWPQEKAKPRVVTRATPQAPTVDGHLQPGEWDGAAKLTNFTTFGADTQAKDQTEVYVTHDATRLYIGYRCHTSGRKPKADAMKRDDSLWEDDSVELFVQPDRNKGKYFQFIGNSAGVYFDALGTDGKWNADWDYKASVGDGLWEGEVSIPFAALGMKPPPEGAAMGFNICRDHQTPSKYASCWSPASGGFHDPSIFGSTVFSQTAPVTRQEPLTGNAAATEVRVHLTIDYKALGINPTKAKLTAPPIGFFQTPAEFAPTDAIPIAASKGWLLLLHE